MGFRPGLVIGVAIGYVLGARAGRQRYRQIVQAFEVLLGSQTARNLETGFRAAWDSAREEFPGIARVGDQMGQQMGQQMGTVLDLHDHLDTNAG